MGTDSNPTFLLITLFVVPALFLAYWAWYKYVAYPIVLEKRFRRGASWLYLPMNWKGNYKRVVFWLSLMWPVSIIGLGYCIMSSHTSLYLLIMGLVLLSAATYFAHSKWSQIRYKQQLASYLFVRSQVIQNARQQVKELSDPEVDRIASFQHKSLLQKADHDGTLLSAMSALK
jgi:hypothetical protein